MNKLNTSKLIEIVLLNEGKIVEARLSINHFLNATHFMFSIGGKFYDEGIDGEQRKVTTTEFINSYKNSSWVIDNIV